MSCNQGLTLTLAQEGYNKLGANPPFFCHAGNKYHIWFQSNQNIELKKIKFFETIDSDFMFNIQLRCRYSTHSHFRNLEDETWNGVGIRAKKSQRFEATFTPPVYIPKTSDFPNLDTWDASVRVGFEYLNPPPGPIVKYAWHKGFNQQKRNIIQKMFTIGGVRIAIAHDCNQVAQLQFSHTS